MAESANIREAIIADIPAINDFLKRNLLIHRHLDWRTPIEWIGHSPFLLLEKDNQLQSLLICTSDPKGIYWIRVLATLNSLQIEECFNSLFPAALEIIKSKEINPIITSIAYQDWMKSLLLTNGWKICQKVVQLRWERRNFSNFEMPFPESIKIRLMDLADIPMVASIDQASFDYLWQHSEDALRRAFNHASYCTVAEKDGSLIAYQITTLQHNRAHIARLAVLPTFQKHHIGLNLVTDVIVHFHKPWTREISVNTQDDNYKSLGLYRKMGFEITDGSFPIFIYQD